MINGNSLYQSRFINQILVVASATLVCVLAVLTFSNPLLYQFCFLLLMLVLCVTNEDKYNLIALSAILLLSRGIGQFWLSTLLSPIGALMTTKIVIYSIAVLVALILRYQLLSRIILVSLLIVIPIEIYWFNSGYTAPHLHFYYSGLATIVSMRFLILMKAPIFRFLKDVRPNNLDFNISELMFVSAIIQLLLIGEYLVRHLSGVQVLFLYNIYPYLQHAINPLIALIILHHTVYKKQFRNTEL